MAPLRVLVLYLTAVFAGGALCAPWVYHLAQWMAPAGPVWADLAEEPFHRYVNRTVLLIALLGLWPFLRGLGIRSWRELGLGSRPNAAREWGRGVLIGFATLALAALLGVWAGARVPVRHYDTIDFAMRMFRAASSAVAVSVLEEFLFRGALFGSMRRAHSMGIALGLSSAIYAIVHFFERPVSPEVVTGWTGFTTLGQMLSGFVIWEKVIPGFLSLTVAGAILGYAYERTGMLYLSMGIHAGWIFWLKFYNAATSSPRGGAASPWWWGSGKLYDGWATLVVLTLVFGYCWRAWRDAERSNADQFA